MRFSLLIVTILCSVFLFCPTLMAGQNDEPSTNCTNSNTTIDGRECVNTVFTALPFLRINPEARGGAMGDVGVATTPDAASIFHNASKLAFIEDEAGGTLTYTPWLNKLVNDIFLGHLAGYYRLDDLQTISGSLRFFSLGSIQFTDDQGNNLLQHKPNEFAFDLAYARKLSQKASVGLTLKYAYSNLAKGLESPSDGSIINAANAIAADLSFYFQDDLTIADRSAQLAFGTSISNIGNKVSYSEDDTKDFIPMNLGIGTNLKVDIDEYNSIALAFDINKLLVPTPRKVNDEGYDDDGNGTPDFREKALISGMLGSFGDAPGGFSEELKELMYSVGLEYWYNNQFAVRLGHFNEHSLKGNRKFISMGLGLKYNVFGLNFSYLIPAFTETQGHPLENTLRFSLQFDLAEGRNSGEAEDL